MSIEQFDAYWAAVKDLELRTKCIELALELSKNEPRGEHRVITCADALLRWICTPSKKENA